MPGKIICHSPARARGSRSHFSPVFSLFAIALLLTVWFGSPSVAQSPAGLDILTGQVEQGFPLVYRLPNLQSGDTIYINARTAEGNLDPFVGIASSDFDLGQGQKRLDAAVDRALQEGQDPLVTIDRVVAEELLAADDDSGDGRMALLTYTIPTDGDYQLLIGTSPLTGTFGKALVAIGINNPQALEVLQSLEDNPSLELAGLKSGPEFAFLDDRYLRSTAGIQEVTGTLTAEKTKTFFRLGEQQPGSTLYAHVEAGTGNLQPILELRDYGGKLLSTGNYLGLSSSGSLEYTFEDVSNNFTLEISSGEVDGEPSTGEFQLLVGIDTPEVLTGSSTAPNLIVFEEPVEVGIGIKLEQITGVNQKAENFSVVALMRMEWADPMLAFRVDECQCKFKVYTLSDFKSFVINNNLTWPGFSILNQQGRRASNDQFVVILPDGSATYSERFSATLQAPDFDFRSFPFDTQIFSIKIKSLFEEEFYVFRDLEGFSSLGDRLGEEEWQLIDFSTTSSSIFVNDLHSLFIYSVRARRHLNYYVLRIFVPFAIIISISWIPSFLRDFGKRIDITNATLLLFMAFNFTIGNDLPRLGYVTLFDGILLTAFLLTGILLIYNVMLKRLEARGEEELARRIDRFTVWLYPLFYIVAFVGVSIAFT